MIKKILSILIPTRNRAKYLTNVVEAVLSFPSNDFELIIQDNSDYNVLEEVMDAKKDDRLIYHYATGLITFSENFEQGLKFCKGEYICIIGDDDGINPEIIEFAFYLSKNQIQSVSFKNTVSYFWPGIPGLTDERNGIVQIGEIKCKIEKFSAKKEVYKLLNNGGQDYLKFGLPKLYHGIVKKEVVDQVIRRYGKCFDSLSPDIFSTMRLSDVITTNYVTDYPFTFAGACSNSFSATSMTKKHVGKLEEAPHFRGFLDYSWSEYVPKFYSVQTIWAESLIYAYKNSNKNQILKYFNTKKLIQRCLEEHPSYKDIILKFAKENNIKVNFYDLYLLKEVKKMTLLWKRAVIRLEIVVKMRSYTKNTKTPDLVSATKFVMNHQYNSKYNYISLINKFEEIKSEGFIDKKKYC